MSWYIVNITSHIVVTQNESFQYNTNNYMTDRNIYNCNRNGMYLHAIEVRKLKLNS